MGPWFALTTCAFPVGGIKTDRLFCLKSVMSQVKGLGYYLPANTLTNQDLEKRVDTTDEWIRKRTGILKRHIASPNEMPSDMALKATHKALKAAGLQAKDLDLILVATLYPDHIMPNTACVLQDKLGISSKCAALDLSAACSGFVYAFTVADQFLQTRTYQNILVVGTETLHHITHPTDRSTCILFGDGAGACILSQSENKTCIHHHELKTHGGLGSLLTLKTPGAQNPPASLPGKIKSTGQADDSFYIQMDGPQVFKKAVEMMEHHYRQLTQNMDLSQTPIDWIVPHQANARILTRFSENTGFPREKIIIDIHDTANTSAASIPIGLCRALHKGLVKRGQNILMIAVGGGMTSGHVFFRY